MRAQREWDRHAAFMDALAADGFFVLGGPLDGDEEFLFLVRAENESEVEARLAADPWVPLGLLELAAVRPWQLLLGAPP